MGFSVVELLIVVVVIGILSGISVVGYGSWQHGVADKSVQHDIMSATSSLLNYRNQQSYFPSNLAGTGFAASDTVALKLMTNVQKKIKYTGLSDDQNAQLLLNSCNAFMPTTDGSTTWNTVCEFAGNNFHIKGTQSSNVLLQGPLPNKGSFVLTCGSVCTAAQNNIITVFEAQGGTWPITIPKKQVPMPNPALVTKENTATDFCLEGRSTAYSDIVYHTTPQTSSTASSGPCPPNAALDYP